MECTGRTRSWRLVVLGGFLGTALGGCSACQPGNPDTETTQDGGGSQVQGDGGNVTNPDGGGGSSSSGSTSMAGGSSLHASSNAGTSSQVSSGVGSSQDGSSANSASGASSTDSSSTGTVSSSTDASSVGGSSSAAAASSASAGASSANASSASNPASSAGGASSTMASSTGSSGGGCSPLVLGSAMEDVYVDNSVALTGTGTLACPFKTILEASSLAAPGNAVMQRTIHVRGHAGSPTAWDYPEAAPILLAPRVTLTSAYDATNLGSIYLVKITAGGSCATLSGTGINCAVGMDHGSTLENVTVSVAAGGTYNAIATAMGVPPSGSAPATIRDVDATGASAAGIRVSGSVTVGPRVNVTQNALNGLDVQVAAVSLSTARPVVTIVDTPANAGGIITSNAFMNNSGQGARFFGDMVIDIGGGAFIGNSTNGLVINTPLGAASGGVTQPTQLLRNIHAEFNGYNGLRLVAGDVKLLAGAVLNTFNGNGTSNVALQGYGIQTTQGDSLGNAHLELEKSTSLTGTYLIAHQADHNKEGGVLLNQTSPVGFGPHLINSLEAQYNGGLNVLGDGVFVQVTGVNQPSATLRGNTLSGNTGAGLRFQKTNTSALDIGTFSGIVSDPGYNIFADNGLRNGKTAVCLENQGLFNVNQEAERDRWSTSPCPFGGPLPATFISRVTGCYGNLNYVDITYVTPALTTVAFTASTCL